MAHAVVSSKFRIVIPREVRQAAGLRVGQVLRVVAKHGVITLIPDQPLLSLKGFLTRMSPKNLREKRDRF